MKRKNILTLTARQSLKECNATEVVSYLAVDYFFRTGNQPTKRVVLVREILKVTAYEMKYPITSRGIFKEIRLMHERGELKFDDVERTFTLTNYPEK